MGLNPPNWTSETGGGLADWGGGGTIHHSDQSLTCHLPLRTPRADWAAARQSNNSRPRRRPRANKPITQEWQRVCVCVCLHWVCDRVQWSKSRNSPRSQGKAQMCRGAFLLAETLFSNMQEPKISRCWEDGFNRERSGGVSSRCCRS